MSAKRFVQLFVLLALLLSILVLPQPVMGGTGVCGDRVTVASGDTLRKIADRCGTSVNALKLANEIKDVNAIKVGQVLLMPGALIDGTGGNDIYIVNHRDTLGLIAKMFKTTVSYLLKLNPSITNANLIYAGQRLNVPETGITPLPTPTPTTKPTQPTPSVQTYIVQKGDTLKKIADRFNTSVNALKLANNIKDVNEIIVGQLILLPGALIDGSGGYDIYIVNHHDTLGLIAKMFKTTVSYLLKLNPSITNANLIFAGQRLNVPETGMKPYPTPTPTQPGSSGKTYIVQKGDTLKKIADRFGTTWQTLMKLNPQIKNANLITVGQTITLP